MYRNQDVYYRNQATSYVRSPKNPAQPIYVRERPIRWGLYEIISSAVFILLSVMFVAGIAALVLDIVGLDSLTQLYRID